MKKRLEIAKQLMSDNGLIFISIDDNEQATLKLLCDEVFGEGNFVANFLWMRTATASNLSHTVRSKMEYVLCYKRGTLDFVLNGGLTDGGDVPLLNASNNISDLIVPKSALSLKIQDGVYKRGRYGKVDLLDDFIVSDSRAVTDLKMRGHFKWSQAKVDSEIRQGTYFLVKTTKFAIRFQRTEKSTKVPSNLITKDECGVGTNEEGNEVIMQLFGKAVFSYAKPPSLIQYLINMHQNKASCVLDFFAGSGTTGHAVMKLNAEDGGKRKFILVTNNENEICEKVTYERLKRVIERENYAAALKYYRINYVPIGEDGYWDLADKLLGYIRELVELENGIDFAHDRSVAIVLRDEEIDSFMKKLTPKGKVRVLYKGHNVMLGGKVKSAFAKHGIEVRTIPDYYYPELEGGK